MSAMVIFMTLPPLSRPRDNLHFCKVRKLAGPSSARILPPVFGVSGNAQKRPWKARGGTAWRKWLRSNCEGRRRAEKAIPEPIYRSLSELAENRQKPVKNKIWKLAFSAQRGTNSTAQSKERKSPASRLRSPQSIRARGAGKMPALAQPRSGGLRRPPHLEEDWGRGLAAGLVFHRVARAGGVRHPFRRGQEDLAFALAGGDQDAVQADVVDDHAVGEVLHGEGDQVLVAVPLDLQECRDGLA